MSRPFTLFKIVETFDFVCIHVNLVRFSNFFLHLLCISFEFFFFYSFNYVKAVGFIWFFSLILLNLVSPHCSFAWSRFFLSLSIFVFHIDVLRFSVSLESIAFMLTLSIWLKRNILFASHSWFQFIRVNAANVYAIHYHKMWQRMK